MLVDERGPNDHAARHCEALVAMLEQAGVSVQLYRFSADARRLTPARGGRALDLGDVLVADDSRRLFVFSDGAGLLDERLGTPEPWTTAFTDWPERMLFTWRDPRDWSRLEFALEARLGFTVLPASEDGLVIAAREIEREISGGPPRRVHDRTPSAGSGLESLLSAASWRAMENTAPSGGGAELIAELRDGLSPAAFDWLCALAYYPALYWSLTLYLGAHVLERYGERAANQALLEIVRLPWLRYGRMPSWLREALLSSMSPRFRALVRAALERMLLSTVSEPAKRFALEVAVRVPETATLDRDERRKDAVLIDLMEPRASRLTDIPIPALVARALGLRPVRVRRLPRPKREPRTAWLGMRLPRPVLVAACVLTLGCLAFNAVAEWRWAPGGGWYVLSVSGSTATVQLIEGRADLSVSSRSYRIDLRAMPFEDRVVLLTTPVAGRRLTLPLDGGGTVLSVGVPHTSRPWYESVLVFGIPWFVLTAMTLLMLRIAWRYHQGKMARLLVVGMSAYAAGNALFAPVPWPYGAFVAGILNEGGVLGGLGFVWLILFIEEWHRPLSTVRRVVDFAGIGLAVALMSRALPFSATALTGEFGAFGFIESSEWLIAGTESAIITSAFLALISTRRRQSNIMWFFCALAALLGGDAIRTVSGFLPLPIGTWLLLTAGADVIQLTAPVTLAYAVFVSRTVVEIGRWRQVGNALTTGVSLIALFAVGSRVIASFTASAVENIIANVLLAVLVLFMYPYVHGFVDWVFDSAASVVAESLLRRLELLQEMFAVNMDAPSSFHRVASDFAAVFDADVTVMILRLDNTFRPVFATAPSIASVAEADPAVRTMALTLRPVDLAEFAGGRLGAADVEGQSALKGACAVPIVKGESLIGFFVLGWKKDGPYSSAERDLMMRIVNSIAAGETSPKHSSGPL